MDWERGFLVSLILFTVSIVVGVARYRNRELEF